MLQKNSVDEKENLLINSLSTPKEYNTVYGCNADSIGNRQALRQLEILGYKPGDRLPIFQSPPKGMPPNEMLRRGLAFRVKSDRTGIYEIIPKNKHGVIVITANGAIFEEQSQSKDYAVKVIHADGLGYLESLSNQGYSTYLYVNGARLNKDVTNCPVLFYECDDITKDEQWAKVAEFTAKGLEPSLVVDSGKSLHVYFVFDGLTVENFTQYQQRLIQWAKSDRAIHNLARQMRLAGFDHTKWVDGQIVHKPIAIALDSGKIYAVDDFEKLLPEWDSSQWSKPTVNDADIELWAKNRNESLKQFQKNGKSSNLIEFLEYEVLPRYDHRPEDLFNWSGHNFRAYGRVLKGQPPNRISDSGTSFHVWHNGHTWAWQDKLTREGGTAVQYRWMLKGGTRTPRGKEFVDIVEELANDVGLELPRFDCSDREPIPNTRNGWLDLLNKFKVPIKAKLSNFAKLPEVQGETYLQSDRQNIWINELANSRNVLDASFTGSGKSHAVGLLKPSMFNGIDGIIYVTKDPRNQTVETLKDWRIVDARHNGITLRDGKKRRAKSGEPLIQPSNCSRVDEIGKLRSKGIDDSIICTTCPLLNACRHNSGDGFGFKHQRMLAMKHTRFICHPDALPSPEDFDYSGKLLIFEEPSDSFKTDTAIKVNFDDIKAVFKLVKHLEIFKPVLNKISDLLEVKSYYGLDYHAIKNQLPELPSSDLLGDLLKPIDLSYLDTEDAIATFEFDTVKNSDKHLLSKANKALKSHTRVTRLELNEALDTQLKQWFDKFLDILNGTVRGSVHIQNGELTITTTKPRLVGITKAAAMNLYLDATINPADLNLKIETEVTVIRDAAAMPIAKIIQVPDFGRMGMQRGKQQNSRRDAYIKGIKANNPTLIVKVIDFKKYEADGAYWRDSRGSNDFKDADILIIVGTPCRHIPSQFAEYSILTGSHPAKDDPDFRAWNARQILADIYQTFGRKAGVNRCKDGDIIYFLSDFDLGDIAHTQIKTVDLVPEAATNLDQFLQSMRDRLTVLKAQGINLMDKSKAAIEQFLGITHGKYQRCKKLIDLLLKDLYSKPISDLRKDTNLSEHDIQTVTLWTEITEILVKTTEKTKDLCLGLLEYFDEYIPRHLGKWVIRCLEPKIKVKVLAVFGLMAIA